MAGRIDLVLTEEFKKSYKKLPAEIQKKVKKQLRFLSENPAHPSLKIHRLNGEWEFYVDIHYRCIFLTEGVRHILLIVGSHRLVDRYKKG